MTQDVFAHNSAQTRPKWILRSVVLLFALLCTVRDASPQWTQNPTPTNSIADLRKRGLDTVLVIDGTGSMNLIIDDIKAKMPQLTRAIHQMVPIARIGIIVFGNKGEKLSFQPLTLSPQKLSTFLNTIHPMGGGEWKEDTFGSCQFAMEKMDWKPYAKKVVFLVGDSPPRKEDFTPMLTLIHKFKDNNGTFNAIDVAAEEYERFTREYLLKHHPKERPKISPLPEFYRQTAQAYRVLAAAGDGEMHELARDESIEGVIFWLLRLPRPQPQLYASNRDNGFRSARPFLSSSSGTGDLAHD
jgi:hypothetical protein